MPLSPRLVRTPTAEFPLTSEQIAVRDRLLRGLLDGSYPTVDVACFCGEREAITIAERDRYGLPVTTVLCPRCGLLRTSPRMDTETTRRFYESDYRELYSGSMDRGTMLQMQRIRGAKFLTALQRAGLLDGVRTVFEVGCGAGGILLPFARAGMNTAGCDLGADYLEVGRAHGLRLVHGDVSGLLAEVAHQADLVVLSHVAEHFTELTRELADVMRAVRPGGYLLVEVPGVMTIPRDYQSNILLYLQNAHNYHFTAATLGYVLRSMGLQLVSADEQVVAIARRPGAWDQPEVHPTPPAGEAARVLRFLAATEKRYLTSLPATQQRPAAAAAMPSA